jgi:Fic family protein
VALSGYQGRTGNYVKQASGYTAFVPANLPYEPPLRMDSELLYLLSNADQCVGRLDAASDMLPNPGLFVGMYVMKEAVLSSQIEGVTQASLAEVLEYEARGNGKHVRSDIAEVINYVDAMNYGLERVETLPLSNRLTREIHQRLLKGVRREDKQPGEFRKIQNWIGAPGSTLKTAEFVPPPPAEMTAAMNALESYMNDDEEPVPVLIKAGLIHSQIETIHPFLDGNGRMGRLLVVFLLCRKRVLKRPLLYLSAFFNTRREEYYWHLQSVRDNGNAEGWMKFFLTAVWKVAEAAASTVHDILGLREQQRLMIQQSLAGSVKGVELLDHLFKMPYMSVNSAAKVLEVSYPTANNLISSLVNEGILEEVTGQGRNRRFRFSSYLRLMDRELEI